MQGNSVARKTILLRRNLKLKGVSKEVRALHELQHAHIIRLVGTYTQGRLVNMLLYPVARLDLTDFLGQFQNPKRRRGSIQSIYSIMRTILEGKSLSQLALSRIRLGIRPLAWHKACEHKTSKHPPKMHSTVRDAQRLGV